MYKCKRKTKSKVKVQEINKINILLFSTKIKSFFVSKNIKQKQITFKQIKKYTQLTYGIQKLINSL